MNDRLNRSLDDRITELWDFGDPAASEARFRTAVSEAPPGASRVELRTQLARALGLQRRFDAANAVLDEAEAELAALPSANDGRLAEGAEVRVLLERGRVHNSSGDPDAARPLFEDAWDLARRIGADGLAVDAAHMVAIAADGDESLAWNRRALDLAETSSAEAARRWRASLLNNLGWTYHDGGDYETALEHFHRAVAAREAGGDPQGLRIARWCVARCLRSLGRLDEALTEQQALAAEYAEVGRTSGYVAEELGELHLALGQPDAARPHFAAAYAELSQDPWLAEREPDRLARLADLGGE